MTDTDRRASVLVIDDDAMILDVMERLLRPDWDVVALTDARDAVRRLAGGEVFDAILCDLTMPKMSGIELYRSVLVTHPVLASHMVFVTGGSSAGDDFLATVSNRVLVKPFTHYALRSIVNAMVRQSRKDS